MKLFALKSFTLKSKQRGVLTLAVSMAILMLSTLVTFNVSKAILMEQKITNNDTRAKLAFEAAEAGIMAAGDYLATDPDRDGGVNTYGTGPINCETGGGNIDCVFDTNADNMGDTNISTVGSATVTVTLTDLSGDMTSVRIVSRGASDDGTAVRTITQTIVTINPLPNAPDNPVITRGSMIIGGSATVHNQEGHSTIWTGSEIDMGSNASTSTEVPDVGAGDYPGCMDIPTTCTLVEASDNQVKGLDVIENDTSLSALTTTEFFQNFFGISPTTYRESMVTVDALGTGANAAVDLATREVIWIEGNAAFSGVTVGCTVPKTGANVCTAAAELKPSIVIVNGDASFSGGSQFYGILFVMGAVDVGGNTTIRGAMITAGDANSSTGGSFDVWYNSDILGATSLAGANSGSAGTWKDF
jgi:Tfp pilus assembly protein PilX